MRPRPLADEFTAADRLLVGLQTELVELVFEDERVAEEELAGAGVAVHAPDLVAAAPLMEIPVLAARGPPLRDPVKDAETAGAPIRRRALGRGDVDGESLQLLVAAVFVGHGGVGEVAEGGLAADVDVDRLSALVRQCGCWGAALALGARIGLCLEDFGTALWGGDNHSGLWLEGDGDVDVVSGEETTAVGEEVEMDGPRSRTGQGGGLRYIARGSCEKFERVFVGQGSQSRVGWREEGEDHGALTGLGDGGLERRFYRHGG